jgi:glycosyltransferase involved in cell wall biosynthesis
MRINYLMESVGTTGGNVVLFHHMEALADDGHDVRLLSPYGETHWIPGTLTTVERAGERPGYRGLWNLAKTAQHLLRRSFPGLEKKLQAAFNGDPWEHSAKITRRLVSNWRDADVTIATHSFTAHAAALLSNRTRAFYHMQGYEPWFSDDARFQAIAELSYKLPLAKIANCQWLRERIQSISRDEIRLVRPGLNHKVFYPREQLASNRSERVRNNQIKVVSYADPRPFKGWRESQEAMRQVFAELSGSYKVDWTVFGNITGGDAGVPVTYRGFLSHAQLAELYSEADLVFLPSWFESFPLQPLEAMSCGAAVITTGIGTEDFARNDQTAVVVEPRNPAALARAVIELTRDAERRRRISANGLNEAKRFTWEQSAAEIKSALGV